jgi:hypothetical protein
MSMAMPMAGLKADERFDAPASWLGDTPPDTPPSCCCAQADAGPRARNEMNIQERMLSPDICWTSDRGRYGTASIDDED